MEKLSNVASNSQERSFSEEEKSDSHATGLP